MTSSFSQQQGANLKFWGFLGEEIRSTGPSRTCWDISSSVGSRSKPESTRRPLSGNDETSASGGKLAKVRSLRWALMAGRQDQLSVVDDGASRPQPRPEAANIEPQPASGGGGTSDPTIHPVAEEHRSLNPVRRRRNVRPTTPSGGGGASKPSPRPEAEEHRPSTRPEAEESKPSIRHRGTSAIRRSGVG